MCNLPAYQYLETAKKHENIVIRCNFNLLLQALRSIKYLSFQSKLLTDYESNTFMYYLFIKLDKIAHN